MAMIQQVGCRSRPRRAIPPSRRTSNSFTSVKPGSRATIQLVVVSRNFAPETERHNWGARWMLEQFESRRRLVTRQLAHAPYMAGAAFTAADISVTYALMLASRAGGVRLGEAEQGLYGSHHRPRCLQAGDGNVSGHEGLARADSRLIGDRR